MYKSTKNYQNNKHIYKPGNENSWDEKLILKNEVRVARNGAEWYLCDTNWNSIEGEYLVIEVEETEETKILLKNIEDKKEILLSEYRKEYIT